MLERVQEHMAQESQAGRSTRSEAAAARSALWMLWVGALGALPLFDLCVLYKCPGEMITARASIENHRGLLTSEDT